MNAQLSIITVSCLNDRKLADLKQAVKLAQTYATKRVIPDTTTLRQLITDSMASYDRKLNVDAKRQDVIRILGVKTERIYPHGKNHLGLYYKIADGDGEILDATITQIMTVASVMA